MQYNIPHPILVKTPANSYKIRNSRHSNYISDPLFSSICIDNNGIPKSTSALSGLRRGLLSGEPLSVQLLNPSDFEAEALDQERTNRAVPDDAALVGSGDLHSRDHRIPGPVHFLVRAELYRRGGELALQASVRAAAAGLLGIAAPEDREPRRQHRLAARGSGGDRTGALPTDPSTRSELQDSTAGRIA